MINNRLNTYASGVFEGRVTRPPVLNQWSDVTYLCEADLVLLNWVNTISPGPGMSLKLHSHTSRMRYLSHNSVSILALP